MGKSPGPPVYIIILFHRFDNTRTLEVILPSKTNYQLDELELGLEVDRGGDLYYCTGIGLPSHNL